MSRIKTLQAREILDSRGNPTLEVDLILESGQRGRASVPSGASTGTQEAVEKRDGDKKRYQGKGVLHAVSIVNRDLQKALKGFSVTEQAELDEALMTLDGTKNKEKLGANTILAVSLAAAKAAAKFKGLPFYQYLGQANNYLLPVPMMNIINGGVHADNGLAIQEFLIIPAGAPTFADALRFGAEIFHTLKRLLQKRHLSTGVGDEGGFAPQLASNEEALDLIIEAIQQAGYSPGQDLYLGLDVASSEFYQDGRYCMGEKAYSSSDFVSYLASLAERYPLISIEDGMAENDWEGWRLLTQQLGQKIQLIGDDIFVTKAELLQQGIQKKVANAILIKPNQIGTLTETLATIQLAKQAKYNTIISHRSGETEDTTIADLAVATQAGQIKTGSLCRTDRVAKYNQLLRIAEELGGKARYTGKEVFAHFGNMKSWPSHAPINF